MLGLFDTNDIRHYDKKESEVLCHILYLVLPGPHVIFYVINSNERFTNESVKSFDVFKEDFGENILKHAKLVFTHLDEMERNNKIALNKIQKNKHIKKIYKECGKKTIWVNTREKN